MSIAFAISYVCEGCMRCGVLVLEFNLRHLYNFSVVSQLPIGSRLEALLRLPAASMGGGGGGGGGVEKFHIKNAQYREKERKKERIRILESDNAERMRSGLTKSDLQGCLCLVRDSVSI